MAENKDYKKLLKKVDNGMYELSRETKEGKKTVKVFLTEKLLEDLDHGAIEQMSNVLDMPGVYSPVCAMSDMHRGYGFSIGGVAAFDLETGCISPGGIGFDINCLTKDSKILTEHGFTKPIQDFEHDFIEIENAHKEYKLKTMKSKISLVSFNPTQKSFSSKQAAYFMKKKHSGKVLQIKTKLGYTLQVSDEHPILTRTGMIKAHNLKNQDIAIQPFKGVEYEEPEDKIIVDEHQFTKPQQNELKKRGLLPLSLKNEKLPILAKLFGYLLGDGTIYFSGNKGFVHAYGPEEDLKEIKEDFKKLGFSAGIYSRTRDHKIPTRYGKVEFTTKNYELHVSANSLANLFAELGYPIGNKTSNPYLIPEWIMNSPLWIKRLFLSGFFGAELSSPRTHTKTGFDCPTISMNKNSVLLENARGFAIQLMTLLEEFDIETHKLLQRKDFKNKNGPTHRLRIHISSKESNLLNLWEKIGYTYNKKRDLLSKIAISYIKYKQLLTKLRKNTAKKAKELRKKGLTVKEIQKLLTSKLTNERFIERHYYKDAGHRITLDFMSFNQYVKVMKDELNIYGCFFDKIESIKKIDYNDYVYDFNIPDTHNFIADNVIVSNCGVRVLTTPLKKADVEPKIKEILESLFKHVPSGVGSESKIRLNPEELDKVLKNGSKWALENNYAFPEDVEHTESEGCMKEADPEKVSPKAKKRGKNQLGTLGAGNHFLEIQVVDEIYDKETAKAFGITEKGQITVMIHCGSRGLGHQVCSDYIRRMEEEHPEIADALPDRDLIYAKAGSQTANDYFGAMCAAANYAWCNRQVIAHFVRQAFKEVFNTKPSDMKQIYDVAHNIAKIEEHEIDGKLRKVYLHRKGATRAFPANHPEVPEIYKQYGQPVLIPGSMGTASYILVGTEKGTKLAYASSAHGAGRVMSRFEAKKRFRGDQVQKELEEKQIYVKAASWKGICEEAPAVYKQIDEVIKGVEEAGIAKKIVRVVPFGVIKG
jgi:tRNA-splicing ligase RtcB (3'-phosphate/5'-hydroxy nucleic acid ligase)